MVLGQILITFGALEIGLKFDAFGWLSGGAQVSWSVGGNWYLSWSSFQQPNSSQELLQDSEYGITHAGIKVYAKNQHTK